MAKIGYARVSSREQSLTIQIDALKAAGCHVIRSEKVSGTSRQGRDELATVLEFLQHGDILCVTRIDRLARSICDLAFIVKAVQEKGAALACTEQPVDTSTAEGKAFLGMLGVFAEFETQIRKTRQLDGISRAKAKGVYRGRKVSIDLTEINRLKNEGMGATQIAKTMGISRASVYRLGS